MVQLSILYAEVQLPPEAVYHDGLLRKVRTILDRSRSQADSETADIG